MALFSRKNKVGEGDDTVHLGSADHSWWTGEEPEDDLLDGGTEPNPEVTLALAEYGYGAEGAGEAGSLPGYPPVPSADDAVRAAVPAEEGDDAAWGDEDTDPDLLRRVLETSLFLHDGLPAEDQLAALLGSLGLEGEADWVDIARAHRRLVTVPDDADADQEQQRRSANEAYARLRLFHH